MDSCCVPRTRGRRIGSGPVAEMTVRSGSWRRGSRHFDRRHERSVLGRAVHPPRLQGRLAAIRRPWPGTVRRALQKSRAWGWQPLPVQGKLFSRRSSFRCKQPKATPPLFHFPRTSARALGAIVRAQRHVSLDRYFRDNFAAPMPFGTYAMWLMPRPINEAYMAGGDRFRPRDFLKFGALILNGGRWNGRRIVDVDWIRQSIIPHTAPEGEGDRYGYGWHLSTLAVGGRSFEVVNAGGNGGQLMIFVPALDLAIIGHCRQLSAISGMANVSTVDRHRGNSKQPCRTDGSMNAQAVSKPPLCRPRPLGGYTLADSLISRRVRPASSPRNADHPPSQPPSAAPRMMALLDAVSLHFDCENRNVECPYPPGKGSSNVLNPSPPNCGDRRRIRLGVLWPKERCGRCEAIPVPWRGEIYSW